MVEVALAIGSNIGDREYYLDSAIARLQSKVNIDKVSSWFENEAVGGPTGQGDFLNGAILGSTKLPPEKLLDFIKEIEIELGRDLNAERWSARVIDIDIIFYGNVILNSTRLIIPHPLMHQRDFVLIPLNEICSDFIHPVLGISITDLLINFQKSL